MPKPTVIGVIPARFGSSRLPGKPLALIAGESMIRRVYERCAQAAVLDSLLVATDDARIADAVAAFGGRAVLTRSDHVSGTDRVAEAVQGFEAGIVVNIQGDQPFIDPVMIEETARPLVEDPSLEICTLMYPISRDHDLADPGVVKVVVDRAGNAMYFSRSLIPYPREQVAHKVFEHVGTYAYRKQTLMRLTQLAPTTLERVEALEQLRWLEHGLRIRVLESRVQDRAFCGFSVDTPADLERAELMLRARGPRASELSTEGI
jgi:3-deoxy-manno-octulosonate cytidylyltransferase (CMP-KDO synthetase)